MASIRLLLDHLGLNSNLVLVCQDWGGLTGLSVVKDMPNAFDALVIMNTGLPDGSGNRRFNHLTHRTVPSNSGMVDFCMNL